MSDAAPGGGLAPGAGPAPDRAPGPESGTEPGAPPPSLAELLRARELRASRQLELIGRRGPPLLSLSLVSPGPIKDSPPRRALMDRAERLLLGLLDREGLPVLDRLRTDSPAGPELLLSVPAAPRSLKAVAIELEDGRPWGRLLDADVVKAVASLGGTPLPEPLTRAELGLPPRPCLLCARPADECRALGRHPPAEAAAAAERLLALALSAPAEAGGSASEAGGGPAEGSRMASRIASSMASRIASAAVSALLGEAALRPKPGLVCPDSRGAHEDMEYRHFVVSARALAPYFESVASAGAAFGGSDPRDLLAALRPLGLRAEEAMLDATGGVNTHKGAIFCLGLLAAAAGRLAAAPEDPAAAVRLAAEAVCDYAGAMCDGITGRELAGRGDAGGGGPTKGELAYREHGVRGARGEAEAGFPALRRGILPILRAGRGPGGEPSRRALVLALLESVASLEDSCLVARGGKAGLDFARRGARRVLGLAAAPREEWEDALADLDRAFVGRRLSPGGSADMLAAGLFLLELEGLVPPRP